MRKNDVNALIEHAKNDFENIKNQYSKALDETSISSTLQINIKNFMENLRSALDYLAHDIYEKHIAPYRKTNGKPEIIKIFFPYGKTENDFKSGVGSSLPDLKIVSIKLYEIIEAIQPYKIGDNWLYDFCKILNDKKHNTLTPQTKTKKQTMTALSGSSSITIPINNPNISIQQGKNANITFNGVPIQLSNQGIEPLAPGLERTITTWIYFKFSDTNIEVLPLLKKSIDGIKILSGKVYQEILIRS
ncbi:MAG TPA: hypothetical protein PKZ43_00410 [Bacteroidales bacterium]|nr:hypothetical protein [Bacteroidales bacterium]HQI45494.1 hypothetical protein [Bacteroidales bacterium]